MMSEERLEAILDEFPRIEGLVRERTKGLYRKIETQLARRDRWDRIERAAAPLLATYSADVAIREATLLVEEIDRQRREAESET